MSEPRELTLDEANALVPTLHRLVSRQMLVQADIETKLHDLHLRTGKLPREIVPSGDDDDELRALKEEIVSLLQSFEDGWAEVTALGCLVKDPRIGLVDFYGRVNGERVCLCWRFGEESIAHYHGLDEGFAGRKPLPAATRHRLFN
jgi:hypothetical protein